MIPKIIHYVWLGGKPLPLEVKDCIKTWKDIMPDYTIKQWNETNFNCDAIPWVKQAINNKMWAFAADYIRLYALYTEGGVYMDTDVAIIKSLTPFLQYSFFSACEVHKGFDKKELNSNYLPKTVGKAVSGFGILSALIAAEKNNSLIKDCLGYYNNNNFILDDNSLNVKIIIPDILGIEAVKYGFIYQDRDQQLQDNMIIFNSKVFVSRKDYITNQVYAIHYNEGSWRKHWWPRRKRCLEWIKTQILHLLGIKRTYHNFD